MCVKLNFAQIKLSLRDKIPTKRVVRQQLDDEVNALRLARLVELINHRHRQQIAQVADTVLAGHLAAVVLHVARGEWYL